MKILFADPDRDLVWSFRELLQKEGNDVTVAYDGAQVIRKAFTEKYDQVIMSSSLPRVNGREIVKMLNEEKCPVIILMSHKVNSDILLDGVLANSHLSFPFFPDELINLTAEVAQKAASSELLSYEDLSVDIGSFLLCGDIRVTNEEINILKSLAERQQFDQKKAELYIGSLNNKLELLKKKTRIRYVMKEGYRLVTDNE